MKLVQRLPRNDHIIGVLPKSTSFFKIWIKTHFYLGEEYKIADWFYLYFMQKTTVWYLEWRWKQTTPLPVPHCR